MVLSNQMQIGLFCILILLIIICGPLIRCEGCAKYYPAMIFPKGLACYKIKLQLLSFSTEMNTFVIVSVLSFLCLAAGFPGQINQVR